MACSPDPAGAQADRRWHVNCRCRVLPVPREGGMEWLASRQGGEAWLQSQDDATLARMMPNEEAREAFRAGTLRLNDFVGEARHPVWGDSVYQLSGKGALQGAGERRASKQEALLSQLQSDSGSQVVRVGDAPRSSLSHWDSHTTQEMVITKPQRDHWRTRHPEVQVEEPRLVRMLTSPGEIHADRNDPRLAAFYEELPDGRFLRVSVWVSDRDDRQNSVLSMRYARLEEVERDRIRGLSVWSRGADD